MITRYFKIAPRLEGIAKSQPEKASIIQPQPAVQAEVKQVPLFATTPNAQAAVITVDHTSLKEFMATRIDYPLQSNEFYCEFFTIFFARVPHWKRAVQKDIKFHINGA
ncbi:hypothetical protein M422DRAFT_249396 [Sphaerobolus stellatus SS14]|uniref:Uncharacterized protein n=1 Tax=Sphaerobolus stellatus (strain SS14) TaxID=990650 RepID=A0A0C9UVL5_SPHS4|nr:hypothetical protein M422DRAFT_249396 [Sphaerobolus stellatus SS14]